MTDAKDIADTARPVIRAVVSDCDGTLVGRDGDMDPRDAEAVRHVVGQGIPFVLATGRIPAETAGYYRELGLSTPLVCYHGALVYADGGLSETVRDDALDESTLRELVEFILGAHPAAQILLGMNDRYVINRLDELELHWDMRGPSRPATGRIEDVLGERVYKLCYFSTEVGRVDGMAREVTARFGSRLRVQQAHAHLAEFLAPGVGKLRGVGSALERLGIGWSEVLAIGDYLNDLEMIRRAGIGVAMGGAPEAVIAAADHVTLPQGQGGVARALERFMGA